MKKIFASLAITAGLLSVVSQPAIALIVDFSDLSLTPASFTNNSSFSSAGAGFNNNYDVTYSSWGGFAYSNTTDVTTPGYTNQYSAITGTNGDGVAGGVYAVAYQDTYTPTTPTITMPIGYAEPVSIRLTNTTYAYLALQNGGGGATAFTDGDWFKVIITGYSPSSVSVGSVDFFLADFRSAVPSDHYIVNQWTDVNLSFMGTGVSSLTLEFASSDTGIYGINTPAYAAVGNLAVIPEPSTVFLLVLGLAGCSGMLILKSFLRRVRPSLV
jgi:hypothetical protein